MSLYVKTSFLRKPPAWPPDRDRFQCPLDSFDVEPTWLTECEESETEQILGPEWEIICDFVMSRASRNYVYKYEDHLWIINSDGANSIANQMSPFSPRVYRAIEDRCRKHRSWPAPSVVAASVALRDRIQAWLRTLPHSTWGVLRVYEWGKY